MRRLAVVLLVVAAGLGAGAWWWLAQPMAWRGAASGPLEVAIEPGTPARSVAQAVADAGVDVNPLLLYAWFRASGQARQIKAGSYEITPGVTPRSLLQKLVLGQEALLSVTLVEGWTFSQVRQALQKAEQLKPDSQGLAPESIMEKLGRAGVPAEGRFFPDTYTYAKGSSDIAVLSRAARAMDKRLQAAWAQLKPGSPLKTPEQALILASIIEKETGQGADRPLIGGVFNNRLRIGMPLQTDPTVIYGVVQQIGDRYDGNLRKRDLLADTPWNTYTRAGLPPTPISMPGKAALLAAVQPADTKALYFVARGDGSSQFSDNLADHNRAVNKFQRGK